MIPTVRLRRASPPDVAVVSVEPTASGAWLVRIARGPDGPGEGATLSMGSVLGPFAASALGAAFDAAVADLREGGFEAPGFPELEARLAVKDRGVRARAALGLGWRRSHAAVPALLAAAASAKGELPSILEGLTRIGDARAVELGREQAQKKLLSRRRAGVELLRALGDEDGLAAARDAARERLPDPVRTALDAGGDLYAALESVPLEKRGIALDGLYELGTPPSLEAVHAVLEAGVAGGTTPLGRPHLFRYVKSVLKRAMVRDDAATFARAVHALDVIRRTSIGKKAKLKSGLDGEEREVVVFSRRTQRWVVRAALRYLRRLAVHRPALYPHVAAALLGRYRDVDLASWSDSVVFHRLLHGASTRHRTTAALKVGWRSAAAAKEAPAEREEPFPALWDAEPTAYLTLLEADAQAVVEHGMRGLARHPGLVRRASPAALGRLVRSRHANVVALARAEIERRFDPKAPDATLLVGLLETPAGSGAAMLGLDLARASVAAWLGDPVLAVRILSRRSPAARDALADIALSALPSAHPGLAAALFERIVTTVEPLLGPSFDPEHARLARLAAVVRVLAALPEPLSALLAPDLARSWVELDGRSGPSVGAYRVIGTVRLATMPDGASLLGERLVVLAADPLALVRRAAQHMVRAPSLPIALLFRVAEGSAADSRAVALERIATLTPETLGIEGVSALCDSTWSDAQALGRSLILAHEAAFDRDELLFRLSESPDRAMRRFALELAEKHLRHGLVPLMRLEAFVRAVLLDGRPDRNAKRRVLDLVVARGLETEDQAAFVAKLLEDIVRTRTRSDFDRILAALARLSAAFPSIPLAALEVRA